MFRHKYNTSWCDMHYNLPMTHKDIQRLAESLWLEYCEIFPGLVKFDCPKIVINNRFTKCAGVNRSEMNQVDLAGKFLAKYKGRILTETLPHELGHQIDFNLNGWYARKPHHGKEWHIIMTKIGVPYSVYPSMAL